MTSPLEGRIALVTGASRNIGAAVAQRLAQAGAAVAVNHRDEDSAAVADQVVSRIRAAGGTAIRVQADVSASEQVAAMVARIEAELGGPDILVNNAAAAVTSQAAWHQLTTEAWEHVLRVNVIGAATCAQAVRPAMLTAGRGDIINMSSVTALLGRTGNLHYVTSKAALIGFTRALARESGPDRIRVNAIVVGAIQTPDELAYGPAEDVDKMLLPLQSLKRRGVPEDIAEVAAFLVSAGAEFITGQCVTVDGGWVMH